MTPTPSISVQPLVRRHITAVCRRPQPHQEEQANVVIDPTSGQELKYRHLIRGPNGDTWVRALANDLGRLAQGVVTRTPTGTNTVFFIEKLAISHGRKVTYA